MTFWAILKKIEKKSIFDPQKCLKSTSAHFESQNLNDQVTAHQNKYIPKYL